MRTIVLTCCLVLASCDSDTASSDSSVASTIVTPTTATTAATTTLATTVVASAATEATTAGDAIVDTWVGPPVDLTQLPLGTAHVSTTGAAAGTIFSCTAEMR